jgi:hypothetical protein
MAPVKGFICPEIPDKHRAIASLLLFKVSWLLLVLMNNSALMPVVLIQIVSLVINPHFNRKYPVILTLATAGFLLEQGAAAVGIITISCADTLPWLALLWFSFVLALSHGLDFLGKLPLWGQVLAGGLLGPLAYAAASRLGALSFGSSLPASLLLLSAGWALFLPIAMAMLRPDRQMAGTTLRQTGALLLWLLAGKADAGQLVGQGTLNFLLIPVYDASLTAKSVDLVYPPQSAFNLKLVYRRAFSAPMIVAETLRQWQAQQVSVRPGWEKALESLIPDINAGDTLELSVDEHLNATLLHNGISLGTIDDRELLEAFVGIWLAPNTTRPKLRNQLLGLE